MRPVLASFAVFAALAGSAAPAVADGPVVVELFTSQGCSSCPPADEILHELAARDDVIALALHVDYWDYIGWADSFARADHTRRQQNYARIAGERSIYTPQMIVAGSDHVVGTKPMDVADLIRDHAARSTGAQISLSRQGPELRITGQSARPFGQAAMVQLVRYTPQQTVEIMRGENAGNAYSYANIVTDWTTVAMWSGQDPLDLTITVTGAGPVVVIVQTMGPGAVLASAVLR